MTQMCVDTTARQAAHLGFQTHLGSLDGLLAEIKTVSELKR